jgi:hypothetical protein
MAGAIRDDEFSSARLDIPVGDINRDALFSLILKPGGTNFIRSFKDGCVIKGTEAMVGKENRTEEKDVAHPAH